MRCATHAGTSRVSLNADRFDFTCFGQSIADAIGVRLRDTVVSWQSRSGFHLEIALISIIEPLMNLESVTVFRDVRRTVVNYKRLNSRLGEIAT